MPTSKQQSKQEKDKNTVLTKLITYFDGYVSLSAVDPTVVDKLLKDYQGTDLEAAWNQIKDDVYVIGRLPATSARIMRYSKILRWTKYGFVFLGFGFLAVLLLSRFNSAIFSNAESRTLLLVGFFALLYGALGFLVVFTRRMNNQIRKVYEEHSGEVAKQCKKIKQATQQLIDKLTMDIRAHGYDPDRYRFELLNRDYNNIVIVKERGQRILATVRARKAPTK